MYYFIEANRFPVIKKLEQNYISKLQTYNRKILIAAVNGKNQSHLEFVKKTFIEKAQKIKTDLVNVFIEFEDDKRLFEYFKIYDSAIPRIIIFDFENSRHFVDINVYDNEENQKRNLENLLKDYLSGNIRLSSGNFIEDILLKLGFDTNPYTMSLIFIGLIIFLVLIVVMIVYFCDSNEPEAKVESQVNDKKENLENKKKEEAKKKD